MNDVPQKIILALFLGWVLIAGMGDRPLAVAAEPPAVDQLIEADLLYLTRDSDDHLAHGTKILHALAQTHPEVQDEVLWRLSRTEKWLGDEATGKTKQLAHYEQAEALAKEGIKVNDRCVECHFWLGVAYGKIGVLRGVLNSLFLIGPIETEMQTVLRLNPQHSGAHHVLGVVYRMIPWFAGGSLEKSIEELAQAVRLNSFSTIHYLELARSYAAAGMKDKGLEILNALEQVTAPYDPTQAKTDRVQAAQLRQELTRS